METAPAARKIPPLLGFALDLLITGHGWSAKELALAAGVSRSTVSGYIREDGLTRERLEELAGIMGLGPADVERAILAARLVLPSPPAPVSPVDPSPEERRIHEKAAALAAGEVLDLALDTLLHGSRYENRQRDLEEGKRLAQELKRYARTEQRILLEAEPNYRHWGLAVVLCAESEALAPRDPARALARAELALRVARHVPGPFGVRLQGWCTGFIANAQRVIGSDLPGAERSFARAWRLWGEGEDSVGLLSKAYLLDMEASLRRDQRLFPKALKLHDDALALARPEEVGVILLNQAATLKDSGDPEGALQIMERASMFIDGGRQPRLRWVLRFNQASSFCILGRAREAAPIVAEVRYLAERLRNEIDLIKTLWLEGNCAAGLDQREEALTKLGQVRRELAVREFPFDYALASLDVALLYREEGRFPEIKILASQILEIFKAQKVHREAIAAVLLFQEAAEREQVTVELVRRLQDYLVKAKRNPHLCFEA